MEYKLSRYTVFTDAMPSEDPETAAKRIAYSTRSGASFAVTEEVFQWLQQHSFEHIEEPHLGQLIDLKIVVPQDVDEFQVVIDENNSNNVNTLGLVVHTSGNCQFGCSYCGQQHVKKNIEPNVKNKIYEYMERKLATGNYRFVFVVWHGAEPLMGLSDLREMAAEFIRLSDKYEVEYSSKIITNGLSLKPNVFNELFGQWKVSYYQITVDGARDYHDQRRMTKEGNPTFDIILKNILDICSQTSYPTELKPIGIRINIDGSNAQGIYGLIDVLAEYHLQKKVSIDLRPVENYADNKFADDHALLKEQYGELEIDLMLYILKKGFSIPDILPGRRYDACMAVIKDHVALDIYGNVFPCYSFPYTKHQLAKENTIGNLVESSTLNQDVPLRNWYQVIAAEKNLCYSCNLLPVCGGYCPLKWMEGSIACPSFKYNIEDRMVLNYLFNKADVRELLNQ